MQVPLERWTYKKAMDRQVPTACILVSTYNGRAYIRPQLDSLLAQADCRVSIFVRDDGSSDGTLEILEEYSRANHDQIYLVRGKNIGAAASFLTLLERSPRGLDGYFFCDQDDIWDPSKVRIALKHLQDQDPQVPTLYCSKVRYIDASGRFLAESPEPIKAGLPNALVECMALGCTMALNAAAREIVGAHLPHKAIMHDWWCYLVITAVAGKVYYDNECRMDYRQHENNLVGARTSLARERVIRLQRWFSRGRNTIRRSDQAKELLSLFGPELDPNARLLLERFVTGKSSIGHRVSMVRSGVLRRRGTWIDQFVLNVQLLINDY